MCIYLVYNIDNKTRDEVMYMRKYKSNRLMAAVLITAAAIYATACNKTAASIDTLPMETGAPVETSGEGAAETDTAATKSSSVADNTKGNSESTSSGKTDTNTSGKNNGSTSSSKSDKNSSGTAGSTTQADSAAAASTKTGESSGTGSQTSAAQNETTTQSESTSQTITEKNTEKSTESTTKAIEVSETTTEAVTPAATEKATQAQTEAPTQKPTENVTQPPTEAPTTQPETTTQAPTEKPAPAPTEAPTQKPTEVPTPAPHVHSYISAVTKAAICAEEGVTTFTCSCGHSYTEAVPVIAHSFGEYVYNNDATTEADGTKTASCSVCGATDTMTAEGTKKSLPSWYDEHPDIPLNVATGGQRDGSLEAYFTNDFDWNGASLGCWDFGYSSDYEGVGEYAEGFVMHGFLYK